MSVFKQKCTQMSETASKELAEVRWNKLRLLLADRGIVRVEVLAEELGVSAATVRRDLAALENSGDLRRIHGGAMAANRRIEEPLFDDKTAIAAVEKQRIAEAAYKLVNPGDIIYLDGGSTVLALARLLVPLTQLTVVTNSLRVAQLFSSGGPRMILTGGECRLLSQTLVGSLTRAILGMMHIDIAFMGTIGVSAMDGLTTTDPAEAYTKEQAMTRTARSVLLADSTKFGKSSFIRFGSINTLTTIITDTQLAAVHRKSLKRAKIELILA